MIWHVIDGDQFLFLTEDDAGDEFLQFIVMFRCDEILSAFDGEHDMDVDLRVGVGHDRNMPLLTELEIFFAWFLQICRAYGARRSDGRQEAAAYAVQSVRRNRGKKLPCRKFPDYILRSRLKP